MNWKSLVMQIALIALGSNSKTAPLVPFIVRGIQEAEDLKGAKGKAKLDHAITIARDGVAAVNAVKPGTINAAAVDAVIASSISAVVDSVNVIKNAKLITADGE